MKNLLEIHVLQNFAPSNLNRDDTGSPKDAIFGGYRRARISSQSLKRSVREYIRDNATNLPQEVQALRTKRLLQELTTMLARKGHTEAEAEQKAIVALGGIGLKIADEKKTQYLVFLGKQEITNIANLIHDHWNDLIVPEESSSKEKGKKAKQEARNAITSEPLKKALSKVLDGGKACQVAHALSTNTVEREFDFYTAVDDLKPDDSSGADMLGTIEFNSACFYRYVALDLEKLHHNLQNDTDLTLKGIEAFLRSIVKAKPSGKQNSFAAHNDPEYIVFTVRQNADPRNLANAFEKPISKFNLNKESLTTVSAHRLEHSWKKLETAYGQSGQTFTLNLTDLESKVGEGVSSLDRLIEQTMNAVKKALGV
jgi:CRISPR system Cascade subunit CasC